MPAKTGLKKIARRIVRKHRNKVIKTFGGIQCATEKYIEHILWLKDITILTKLGSKYFSLYHQYSQDPALFRYAKRKYRRDRRLEKI